MSNESHNTGSVDPDQGEVQVSESGGNHRFSATTNSSTEAETKRPDVGDNSDTWQTMLAQFTMDWQAAYDEQRPDLNGMRGFVTAFASAFSRFSARAKLLTQPIGSGKSAASVAMPESVGEMLEFMARVYRDRDAPRLSEKQAPDTFASVREPLVYQTDLGGPDAGSAIGLLNTLALIGEAVGVATHADDCALFSIPSPAHALPPRTPAVIRIVEPGAGKIRPFEDAQVKVARAQFPTDRLPRESASWFAVADRVWVSSEFNRGTFVRGGVDRDKIAVISEVLDPALFAIDFESGSADIEPFTILADLEWSCFDGWDVLLEAFAGAFSAEEAVRLQVRIAPSDRYDVEEIRGQADAWLLGRVGRGLAQLPHIQLVHGRPSPGDRPSIYQGVHAAVYASRGDGTGRRLLEAMAAGLPTIATAWGGAAEIYNRQVGFPVQYRIAPVSDAVIGEQPQYADHWWAEPNIQDVVRQMRAVFTNRDDARARGLAARDAVRSRHTCEAVAPLLKAELARCRAIAARRESSSDRAVSSKSVNTNQIMTGEAAPLNGKLIPSNSPAPTSPTRPAPNPVVPDLPDAVDFHAVLGREVRLILETGRSAAPADEFRRREIASRLQATGDVKLAFNGEEESPAAHSDDKSEEDSRRNPASADITILDRLSQREGPPGAGAGKVVIWPSYDELCRYVDGKSGLPADPYSEIWAPTRWFRDALVRSGAPAEKLRLIPAGVRSEIFTPEGPPFNLGAKKATRLLFVGPLTRRAGADSLLRAYLETFRPDDDVCLIVSEVVEGGPESEDVRSAILRAQADPKAPLILLAPRDIEGEELASLYRASTCVVSPHRNEPTAIGVLQAMSCGLPVIVTAGGAAEDYLDDAMGLRVPSLRAQSPQIGETMPEQQSIEPDLEALRQALRWVAQHPEEARRRGEAARAHILKGWTWDRSAAMVRERLYALAAPATASAHAVAPAKRWVRPRDATRQAAKKSPHRPKPGKIEISFCLIARNEEARIRYCLESIAPYVGEMIVVDTGSSDRTREIAYDCGAQVFDFPWTDSFSEARNQSISLARGKWIFWMDADDVITPECGERLRSLVHQNPAKDTAYSVQVRIPPGPGEFSSSVVDHVKLFPNLPGLRFEHRIHEQILPALREAGIEITFSDLFVVHQHYDRSPDGQARKRKRDFRLLELDLAERPEHPFVLFNFGMTYLYATKEFEVAAQYLRRSLNAGDWRASIVRKTYAMLTTARICQQDWRAASAANEQGRAHYPADAELLFQAGQIYANLGRIEEARSAFERLINGSEDPHYQSVDIGLRTYRGRHELALLHRRCGDARACIRLLQETAEQHPDYIPARIDLVDALHGLKEDAAARAHLAAIPRRAGIEQELQSLYERLGVPWSSVEAV